MGLFRNQITEQTFQLSFEQLNRNELFKNSFIELENVEILWSCQDTTLLQS